MDDQWVLFINWTLKRAPIINIQDEDILRSRSETYGAKGLGEDCGTRYVLMMIQHILAGLGPLRARDPGQVPFHNGPLTMVLCCEVGVI